MEEVDAIEYDRFILNIFMQGLSEIMGMFGPMHAGFNVVADVVTIVPALVIILCIDTGDTVFIGIVRVAGTDERVLGPITEHHNDPGNHKWQDKYYQGSREVDKRETYTH